MRRQARSRVAAWLLAAVSLGTMTSCTPLFVPPVPSDPLSAAASWRVAGDAELRTWRAADGAARLRARLRFDEVPASAWVAVQWFGPTGGERASASRWVVPGDLERWLAWDLPTEVIVTPGAWRVLVSVDGRPLRQLDVVIAPPAGD